MFVQIHVHVGTKYCSEYFEYFIYFRIMYDACGLACLNFLQMRKHLRTE